MKQIRARFKTLASFLSRVDIYNRIMVFLSQVFFVVVPSLILYNTHDYSTMKNVMPSLMILGIVIGTGLFTLYKPIKTAVFYFLETLLALLFYREDFLVTPISSLDSTLDLGAIYWTEFSLCLFGFALNLVFFLLYYQRFQKGRTAFDEQGNGNTVFNVTNGMEINEDVEKRVEKISEESGDKRMKIISGIKLSRICRILSFVFYLVTAAIYLLNPGAKYNPVSSTAMYFPLLMGMIFITISGILSIFYPGDYKYLYYFNMIFFTFTSLLCTSELKITPVALILLLFFDVVALMTTLITEGRTWMGAKPDSK
ncbi:MAG: hypothetical protein WCR16_01980 [Bacilli bacterium]